MPKKLLPKKLKGSRKPTAEPPAAAVPPPAGTATSRRKRVGKVTVKGKNKVKARTATVASGLAANLGQSLAKLARRRRALGAVERLEMAVDEVRLGGRDSPRTRRLLAAGLPKMAQKVIEEAGEAAIEAVRGDAVALVNETADLFYNVVVMLRGAGIPVAAVWEEMARRELALGMAEKLPKAVDPDG